MVGEEEFASGSIARHYEKYVGGGHPGIPTGAQVTGTQPPSPTPVPGVYLLGILATPSYRRNFGGR